MVGKWPVASSNIAHWTQVRILWRALFFFLFFSLLFFFSLSLSARWFNTYQIPILFLSSFSFFPSLALFFFPFLSSSPLAFLLFSFSYSFPIPFLLLFSFFLPLSTAFLSLFPPFLHFSHRLALMPAPPPPPPPHYSFKKSWGEH